MEDSWIFVDDSSNCSQTDSDKIDSETEAELYSKIHHEPNLSCINSENINEKSPGLSVYSPFKDDTICTDKIKNASTPMKPTSEYLCLNQIQNNNFSNGKRKSSEMDTDFKRLSEKLSPVKKHKSKSVCKNVNLDSHDLENLDDSLQCRISNIQYINRVFNSNLRESNKKNSTVVLNSSDSDSDIWIEQSSTEKNGLKINLLKDIDTVFLSSSDSDSEPDVLSPCQKRDSVLRNLSMPNLKTDENSTGLWHINSEDLHRSKKHFHRYHDNFDITCSNCNRKGHTSRACPSPRVIKCFVCGGNHMGFKCSNRICSNCHASGHDRKNCWREAFKGFCHLCNMGGHAKGNCPDLWRRYHLTTSPLKIKKGKQLQQNTNLYCWNCGKGGHFGAVCPLLHASRNNFSTWPCVVSYDNPKGLLKQRLAVLRKCSFLNMGILNRNVNISRASPKKKNIHPKPRNNPNIPSGSNEENSINKSKKEVFRTDLKFSKTQGTVKERNFPRTPKKSPIKCSSNFVKPETKTESPQVLTKKQLKNLRRKFNNQMKRTSLIQLSRSQETVTQDGASNEKGAINYEDDLPEFLKLHEENKQKKWRKNRMNRLRKRKQKRELINVS